MGVITDHLDLWGEALQGTVTLFFGGAGIAIVLGLVIGAMRVSPIPVARSVGALYVNTVRNTPLTLVVFAWVFIIPLLLQERLSSWSMAVIALGLYTASYVAETIRAGINTVPVGQAEAARAIGLSFGQVMGSVVLPQAVRSVIPPMMSVLIALLKNTTVAAGFSVMNLGSIRDYMSERGENLLVVILLVMAVFVGLVFMLAWVQRVVENKWRIAR